VLVDFGAEHAFNRVHHHIREHYGIELPQSLPRRVTLYHAGCIASLEEQRRGQRPGQPKACIISETDGSMVPIVNIDAAQSDKRKQKTLCYREARLTLAREKGSLSPVFSATLNDVSTAGEHMADCVQRVGLGPHTYLHSVGDGAPWIAEQMEAHFGSQADYLIDFYHVCDYLAAAAPTCRQEAPSTWLEEQKHLLKANDAEEVIENLCCYIEPATTPDKEAPVRACHRYLSNRLHQLNYKAALDNDLPIGSGEIESAHRYIIQKRLKIQGAWWLVEHVEAMLALRTHRANNEWASYWHKAAA